MPDDEPTSNHSDGEQSPDETDQTDPAPHEVTWQPPTLEELGQLLPLFRIDELLGLGGMGAVYKAYQANLARFVAIKLLSADYSTDEAFVATFKNEARILAQLHHPRIIAIHDLGETSEGHLYFIMEYIEGRNLRTVLSEGPLPQDRALELTSQICDALHAAHGKGIVHRDIKPENILIDDEGNVKLVDFGLAAPAREAGAGPSGGVIMGTPDYSAPEVLEDEADHRADLFALGVMLYEMLTGGVPSGEYLPASSCVKCDVRIDRIIARAVQPDRETRYQCANDFKTMVDHIRATPVGDLKVSAMPQARPIGTPSFVPTARPVAVAVKAPSSLGKVLLIAAVLLGAGWFFMKKKDTPVQVAGAQPTSPAATQPPSIEKPPIGKEEPPSLSTPGAKERKTVARVEGEKMTIVKVTNGETKTDDMAKKRTSVWGGGEQIYWSKGGKDDVLTLRFPVWESGLQRVKAVLTAGKDFAVVEAKLDGKEVPGSPFDQYTNHSTILGTLDFGVFDLSQGEHEFQFRLVDAHGGGEDKTGQYNFGLDQIVLEPPTRTEPPAAPGTDLGKTARASASTCANQDNVTALNNGKEPPKNNNHDYKEYPRFTWHPRKQGLEWVQYEWETPQVINECQIFWFNELSSRGGCVLPQFWRILYREESGAWVPVDVNFPEAENDKWSTVRFPSVKTMALRISVQCQNEYSAGIYAWKALAADPATVSDPKQQTRPDLFLGDISPLHSRVGQGVYGANIYNNDDKGKRVVLLGGKECTQFLWAHAPSWIEFAIPSGYDRFKTTGIGPSFSAGERLPGFGLLKLSVQVDGKTVFASEELTTYPNFEVPVDVKIPAGSKTLTLLVDHLGDNVLDHAFWANPTLIAGEGSPSKIVSAPRKLAGLSAAIANTKWDTINEVNQRAWGDLTFLATGFSTMNGIAGGWKETGPLTVELGTTYILQFTEDLSSFVATTKAGTKVVTGARKAPSASGTGGDVAAGFKPIYETGFEQPVFTQGAFVVGRAQPACRTDMHWALFNVGTTQIDAFTTGVEAVVAKTGKQALWVNAKAANKNRCGFSATVENPGGSILVSADVFFANSARKTRWQFAVGDPDAPSGYVGGINIDAEGRGIQLITKGGTLINEPIKRDVWMRIQVRVDVGEQTFDVFIDGKDVALNAPVFAPVKRVRTFQFATAGDGDDRAFFDNFSFAVGP